MASTSNWLMACVASDKLNMTPTHTPPRNYPPVIRIVGSLWRALYVIHGDVLHDPTTRIARRKISKDGTICCTRCGTITTTTQADEQEDEKDKKKKDDDRKQDDATCATSCATSCATCGCENPSTFLNEIDGSTIHIGSFLRLGNHGAPAFVIALNRADQSAEIVTVRLHGRVVLQRKTLTQKELTSSGTTLRFTGTTMKRLNEEEKLSIRRLVLSMSEYCICGRCDQMFHVGDLLSRKVRDLKIAAESMKIIKMKIIEHQVQKETLIESLQPIKKVVEKVVEKEEEGKEEEGKEEEGKEEEGKEEEGKEEEGKLEGKAKEGKEEEGKDDDKQEEDEAEENCSSSHKESSSSSSGFHIFADEKEISLSPNEKSKIKKTILTLTNVLKEKKKKIQMLKRLEKPIIFSCPDCQWTPWNHKNKK